MTATTPAPAPESVAAGRIEPVGPITPGATFRVLVTGSRSWRLNQASMVYDNLLRYWERLPFGGQLVVVHGDCPTGPDAMASNWVRSMTAIVGSGVVEEKHPADWDGHGKSAGYRRNAEMVKAGADALLGFIAPCIAHACVGKSFHWTHGASNCVLLATAAGFEEIHIWRRR